MPPAEFDDYVALYDQQHRQSIRLSGEAPDYFAAQKIAELARLSKVWALSQPKVLDFGSGLGNSLPSLRRFFPTSAISCADVSAASLAGARALHGGQEAQLLIADGKIPAADGSFDLAFAACVFHHIDHAAHDDCLREIRRVLRPGGRLVVFEHNPLNPLTRHAVRHCPFDANAHLIGAWAMRQRLARAGFVGSRIDFHLFFPAALRRLRGLEPLLRWCPAGAQYACHGAAPL